MLNGQSPLDDVLSLIRSLAQDLQDPPEIPTEAALLDEQQVEQAATTPHVGEYFVDQAQPKVEPVKPPAEPDPRVQQVDPGKDPEAVQHNPKEAPVPVAPDKSVEEVKPPTIVQQSVEQHQPISPVQLEAMPVKAPDVAQAPPEQPQTPEPEAPPKQGVAEAVVVPRVPQPLQVTEADIGSVYHVKESVVQPRSPQAAPAVEYFDPPRVAAAQATAQFNEKRASMPAEVRTREVVDVVQVNANTRVHHMVPESFPVSPGQLWGIIDRDVDLPDLDLDSQRGHELQLPEPVEVVSTEELVARSYQHEDLQTQPNDRSIMS